MPGFPQGPCRQVGPLHLVPRPRRSPHPGPTKRWWDASQGLPAAWTPAGNPICLRLCSAPGACQERPRQARVGGRGRTWEPSTETPACRISVGWWGERGGFTGGKNVPPHPSAAFPRKRHPFSHRASPPGAPRALHPGQGMMAGCLIPWPRRQTAFRAVPTLLGKGTSTSLPG